MKYRYFWEGIMIATAKHTASKTPRWWIRPSVRSSQRHTQTKPFPFGTIIMIIIIMSLRVSELWNSHQMKLSWSFLLFPIDATTHIHTRTLTQYVNRAASTIRGALKEPAKSRLAVQDEFSFKKSDWSGGVQGPKTEVKKHVKH